ncbi:MAG: hypothetical protein RL357_1618 [Pseudomonadota bacterium]
MATKRRSRQSLMTQLVFITGASSGIGWALAQAYAAKGCRLALVVRDRCKLQALMQGARVPEDLVQIYEADVTDEVGMRRVAAECLATQGLPDVVIANAGISRGVMIERPEDWPVLEQTWRTNVLGVAHTLGPFVSLMRTRGSGRLVAISSVAGVRGLPGHAAYSSSKAACTALCESLRADLTHSGVRVTVILPGYIDTPMTKKNPFPMPFLMDADGFAQRALRAIDRGQAFAVIPRPMALAVWLLKWLPASWLDKALGKQPRKPRDT